MNEFDHSTVTILIVDDQAENVNLLVHFLSKDKFQTLSAFDANQARDILLTNTVDILLLDVHMPGQSGFDFCKELRDIDKFKLLPIIFITSMEKEIGFEEAVSNGGDDFINKPVNPKELRAKIRAMLRIKSLQDSLLAEKNRAEKEMKMARKVQEQLIPERNIEWNGIQAKTLFYPVLQIGGDFVDVWVDNEQMHVVIADCSGHGPSAALIGAMFKMQVLATPENLDLIQRVKFIRENLSKVLPEDYSITFFYAIIDKNYNMNYINGGHPFPLLFNSGEITEVDQVGSMIINLDLKITEKPSHRQLKKGDILLLFTDAAIESQNEHYEMIEDEGLRKIFAKSIKDTGDILENVKSGVLDFCYPLSPEDDLAMVCLKL